MVIHGLMQKVFCLLKSFKLSYANKWPVFNRLAISFAGVSKNNTVHYS